MSEDVLPSPLRLLKLVVNKSKVRSRWQARWRATAIINVESSRASGAGSLAPADKKPAPAQKHTPSETPL
ncbi:unnamed protein product, partial [Brenthis ino]